MMKQHILIFYGSKNNSYILDSLISLLNNFNYKKYNVDLYLDSEISCIKKFSKKVNIIRYDISKSKIKFCQFIKNFFHSSKINLKNHNKYDCAILYGINSKIGNSIVRNASKNRIMYIEKDYIQNYSDETVRHFFTKRHIYEFNNLIFMTQEAQEKFLKYYPSLSPKVHIINSIINIKELEKQSNLKIDIKFKRSDLNLISISSLEEEKNHISKELELIKDLKIDFPHIKLFIIGEGIDKDAYQSYIEDNNLTENIFLLGNRKNIYSYIKKCNYLFTMQISQENIPYIFNCPLIKTDVISFKAISDDFFKFEENYGYLLSNDYNKMKVDLKEILNNKNKHSFKFNVEEINNNRIEKLEKIIDNI